MTPSWKPFHLRPHVDARIGSRIRDLISNGRFIETVQVTCTEPFRSSTRARARVMAPRPGLRMQIIRVLKSRMLSVSSKWLPRGVALAEGGGGDPRYERHVRNSTRIGHVGVAQPHQIMRTVPCRIGCELED